MITYNNLNIFLGNLTSEYAITSVMIEDMSTYKEEMSQQVYFMVGDKMVAHWSPSAAKGAIIGIKASSQWSTRYRKFKTLTFKQFIDTLKRK